MSLCTMDKSVLHADMQMKS